MSNLHSLWPTLFILPTSRNTGFKRSKWKNFDHMGQRILKTLCEVKNLICSLIIFWSLIRNYILKWNRPEKKWKPVKKNYDHTLLKEWVVFQEKKVSPPGLSEEERLRGLKHLLPPWVCWHDESLIGTEAKKIQLFKRCFSEQSAKDSSKCVCKTNDNTLREHWFINSTSDLLSRYHVPDTFQVQWWARLTWLESTLQRRSRD